MHSIKALINKAASSRAHPAEGGLTAKVDRSKAPRVSWAQLLQRLASSTLGVTAVQGEIYCQLRPSQLPTARNQKNQGRTPSKVPAASIATRMHSASFEGALDMKVKPCCKIPKVNPRKKIRAGDVVMASPQFLVRDRGSFSGNIERATLRNTPRPCNRHFHCCQLKSISGKDVPWRISSRMVEDRFLRLSSRRLKVFRRVVGLWILE